MNITSQDTDKNESLGRLSSGDDLPDSPHDEERMKPEEVVLDLPDVKDIPGQEHIHVPNMGMLADTTISSDDEEGVGLFDDEPEEDADLVMGTEADISAVEQNLLQKADEDMPGEEDSRLRNATLDNEDEQGEMLNEGSSGTDISGADLDITGSDEDDPNEAIGEEDEENNIYSLGGDDNE